MPTKTTQPDVKVEGGRTYREVEITAADGSVRIQRRPVAETFQEAQERRWDFYHPELGWILEGYKLAVDRPIKSIMADGSSGGARLPAEDSE